MENIIDVEYMGTLQETLLSHTLLKKKKWQTNLVQNEMFQLFWMLFFEMIFKNFKKKSQVWRFETMKMEHISMDHV
jgi:hypothetical protein